MGFNFEQIGEIVGNVMDTDKIDIGREMEIINPDGSTGETRQEEPIYRDIPCHIAFNTSDNPDPSRVDTAPIIVSMTIHLPLWVDIQNNDYVYAHKCDSAGEVLETYQGRVGFHTVNQSRKSVQMAMRKNV